MPLWNGGTGSISAAEVQAACEAAIVAENLPSQAEVQTACEAALTAAGIPTALEVQAACEDALTAQAGVAVPSVAQIQTGLSTSVEVAAVQSAVDLLPSAADVATAVGAQAAAAAAITAAAGVAIPSVVQNQAGLSTSVEVAAVQATVDLLPSAADVATAVGAQAAAQAAITASVGTALVTSAQVQTACEDAILVRQVASVADVDVIPTAVQTLAVGSFAQKTTVTISGAGTSGTLIAAGGVGIRTYIVGILVSCTVGNSTMQLVSTGGVSTGVHSILLNNNLSMSLPFGIIARSGSNTAITCNKTASQTLIFDVWYYQGS